MSAAPGLARLQLQMQESILHGDGFIERAIAVRAPFGVADRLGVYHHAYRARLADALRDAYGHTATMLGEAFEPLALAFVQSHPSHHASLRAYGAGFPEWLLRAAADRPGLGELARLDRALRGAFDCADSPVATLGDLAALDPAAWGGALFEFTHSYDRVRLEHNTLAAWQAIDDEHEPPEVVRLDRPLDVLVWRRGLQPHFRSLDGFEAAALDHLRAPLDFATTCERLAESYPDADVAPEAGRLLRRWVEEELLARLVIPSKAGIPSWTTPPSPSRRESPSPTSPSRPR